MLQGIFLNGVDSEKACLSLYSVISVLCSLSLLFFFIFYIFYILYIFCYYLFLLKTLIMGTALSTRQFSTKAGLSSAAGWLSMLLAGVRDPVLENQGISMELRGWNFLFFFFYWHFGAKFIRTASVQTKVYWNKNLLKSAAVVSLRLYGWFSISELLEKKQWKGGFDFDEKVS